MEIRLNKKDRDHDGSLDQPSMDPSKKDKFPNEDEERRDAKAEFPANVGNDLGQYTESEGDTYPPFPEVTEAVGGEDAKNAAQRGGSGPRVDDLGISDLQDQPNEPDLEAIEAFTQDIGDIPVFDRSIENIEVGEAEIDTNKEDTRSGRDERLPEKLDQLADEESEVYDVSIDGPGTRDLH